MRHFRSKSGDEDLERSLSMGQAQSGPSPCAVVCHDVHVEGDRTRTCRPPLACNYLASFPFTTPLSRPRVWTPCLQFARRMLHKSILREAACLARDDHLAIRGDIGVARGTHTLRMCTCVCVKYCLSYIERVSAHGSRAGKGCSCPKHSRRHAADRDADANFR